MLTLILQIISRSVMLAEWLCFLILCPQVVRPPALGDVLSSVSTQADSPDSSPPRSSTHSIISFVAKPASRCGFSPTSSTTWFSCDFSTLCGVLARKNSVAWPIIAGDMEKSGATTEHKKENLCRYCLALESKQNCPVCYRSGWSFPARRLFFINSKMSPSVAPLPRTVAASVQGRLIGTAVKVHYAGRCLSRIHQNILFILCHPSIVGPCKGIHGDIP